MSLFNKMFGRKQENEVKEVEPISLDKAQTINLRKETLTVSLKKNNMENTVARVAVAMDQSGSMRNLYRKGKVQDIIERLLPIALKLDDNAELDMWLFSERYKRLESITEQDFDGYIDRTLKVSSNNLWGGTDYAPVINDITKKYTSEEPSNIPTLVLFITDGENFDKEASESAIKEASKHNIFWQFIGIGNERFNFLRKLDEMEGRVIDNANFFAINDLSQITDKDLYDRLLSEYPSWEREAKIKGIL